MKKIKLKINNIKCDSCVLLIEDRLKDKEGIVKIKVSAESGNAIIFFDEEKINENEIIKDIESVNNFKAVVIEDNNTDEATEQILEKSDSQESIVVSENAPFIFSRPVIVIAVSFIIMLVFMFIQGNKFSLINSTSIENQQETQKQQPQALADNQQLPSAEIVKSDKPILEAYIVSNCPFGLQMQRVLADVIKNAPLARENIKVRYMGTVSNGKITSMHGDKEAQENLKQICIRDEQNNKYWDYVSCYMKKGDTQGCLDSTGINITKLDSCVSDSKKGLAYAEQDFVLNRKYSIKGSPTLIMGGAKVSEFNFGGRTSEALKTVICSGFIKSQDFVQLNLQQLVQNQVFLKLIKNI